MFPLLRKIHMYVGLLSWSIILVMGIAGLEATLSSALNAPRNAPRTRVLDFAAPPNVSDAELAEAALRKARIPFTQPDSYYDLHRDRASNVCFHLWTLSKGGIKVTVLEPRRQIQIDEENPSFWLYLNNLHTVTVGGDHPDWRVRYWSYYTEIGIWTLLALAVSGVWQWLASRPGHRWAQVTLLLGSIVFGILYVVMR